MKMSCFHAKAHLVFHWHLYDKYYMLVIYITLVVNKKVLTGKPTLMASKSKISIYMAYTLECCIRWIFLYNLSFLVSSYDLFEIYWLISQYTADDSYPCIQTVSRDY